jgi:hypothetical protein
MAAALTKNVLLHGKQELLSFILNSLSLFHIIRKDQSDLSVFHKMNDNPSGFCPKDFGIGSFLPFCSVDAATF